MFESRSSVLFCLWEMSGIIPTPVGQPDLLPFFRDPGVTQVQGPSDGCSEVWGATAACHFVAGVV